MLDLTIEQLKGAGDVKRLGEIYGDADALVIAQLAKQSQGVTLVLTNNSDEAERVSRALTFFTPSDIPVIRLPDWETLPYDVFSPHQDIISERIETLYRLPRLTTGLVVMPVATALQRLPPSQFITGASLVVAEGDAFDSEDFRRQLSDCGYSNVTTVHEHGEFAVRGDIIDVFPMGAEQPIRILLDIDEVESLRTFDPENQRTLEKIEKIKLLPAKEFPFTKQAIRSFKQRWRETFDVDHRHCPVYEDVGQGLSPSGIEYYLPLFFDEDETVTVFDYLPNDSTVVSAEALETQAHQFLSDVRERYESRRHDIRNPILPPSALYLLEDGLFQQLKNYGHTRLHRDALAEQASKQNLRFCPPADLAVNHQAAEPLAPLADYLNKAAQQGEKVLICAESAGRREALTKLLSDIAQKPATFNDWQSFITNDAPLGLCVFPLTQGIQLPKQVSVISESQLFGRQVFQQRRNSKSKYAADQVVKNLTELAIGAPVVHIDHGVGRYLGLEMMTYDGETNEFLTLEYANDTKLYVPVTSLHLISRYSGGSDESAPLHKLGAEQWTKAKQKAAEQARDSAAELLDIYARRGAKQGFAYAEPDDDYQRFAQAFPFEETPDQTLAIAAVIRDMTSKQPMDRLVCGDVGFGKTEVAMRAAFLACQSSKQVAVLVPTTLLAQQHYDSFADRFADWPVNVELISRFKSAKQQTKAAEQLASGEIDIIIGTHKLLQGSIEFKDLGLVIIDEEHRFGVAQKERLKSLRSEVDILNLTATPIPRTLNMAMSGIRDLSIIATPPARRLSVKTFVHSNSDAILKEAILRELRRGGQVYYLHNEVKSIERAAEHIMELIPEARVGVGHGQMRERELEQVMSDFYHKRHNILVCSTIIETGIDVPNANTIIINRADKFGLAQLHQLRGRVGRSHHQSYAYLMTPDVRALSKDASRRLEAIANTTDLGAGFTLATHDLEIRGAGELLGDGQSGQMQTVGYSLFIEMLEEAVNAIRSGNTPDLAKPLQQSLEVNMHTPSLIPEDYLRDVHARLILYKRIANAKTDQELHDLEVEMIDRFGLLPSPVETLLRITKLRLFAQGIGVIKIDVHAQGGTIAFDINARIDRHKYIMLLQSGSGIYAMAGPEKLRFTLDLASIDERFDFVEGLLQDLKCD
ncbi:MAG: transcription-repair coupling factor [Pontibacterium sp.]